MLPSLFTSVKGMSAIDRLSSCLQAILALSVGALALHPNPALSAERIYFDLGPVLFPLSVESLEIYAKEGRITSEFAPYARQFNDATKSQLRQMLQKPYQMDEVAIYRTTQTPIVEDFLKRLGTVIQTPSGINGFYAIRGALLMAAAQEGNWTVLDVIKHYPTDIRIDTTSAMQLFNPQTIQPSDGTQSQSQPSSCQPSSLFY